MKRGFSQRGFLQGGWRLLVGSRIGYQVCGYFPFWRNLIAVPFFIIRKIEGPPQWTSSVSYPRMEIFRLTLFEPFTLLCRGVGSCHSFIFPQLTRGVRCLSSCPLSYKTLLTNSWSLVCSFFPWTPPDLHINRLRGMFSGSEAFWYFQIGKTPPGRQEAPIHSLLFLTTVITFCRLGILSWVKVVIWIFEFYFVVAGSRYFATTDVAYLAWSTGIE